MSAHQFVLTWQPYGPRKHDTLALEPAWALVCLDPTTCPPVLNEDGDPMPEEGCWFQHAFDTVGIEQFALRGEVSIDVDLTGCDWDTVSVGIITTAKAGAS